MAVPHFSSLKPTPPLRPSLLPPFCSSLTTWPSIELGPPPPWPPFPPFPACTRPPLLLPSALHGGTSSTPPAVGSPPYPSTHLVAFLVHPVQHLFPLSQTWCFQNCTLQALLLISVSSSSLPCCCHPKQWQHNWGSEHRQSAKDQEHRRQHGRCMNCIILCSISKTEEVALKM